MPMRVKRFCSGPAELTALILLWVLAQAAIAAAGAASNSAAAIEHGFWISLAFVQLLTALGYCCSSLARWAKWHDGTLEDKLLIGQGVAVSLLGGNIGYFGGMYYLPSIGYSPSEMACFIVSALAGYGGEKFVGPLLNGVTEFLGRLFPKGPATGKKDGAD